MANKRLITSDIWADDFFGTLPMMERLLWIGLFSRCADDQGRMVDNPIVIRSTIFPYDDIPAADIDAGLSRFESEGKILRYTHEGKKYIQLLRWWEHQTMQWAMQSKYPAPPAWDDRVRTTYKGKYIAINWPTSKPTSPAQVDNPGGDATLPPDVGRQNLNLNLNPVVVEEPLGWETDPTIGGKPPTTTAFASESIARSLLMKIAQIAFIPDKQKTSIEAVHSMIDVYGLEKTEAALDAAFKKWVATKKKNGGGTYSALNFGWVDWAQESLLEIAPPAADDYYAGWELH